MAEPVRKCASCRLRLQGVRQLEDGLSYCAKCIAQLEDERAPDVPAEDSAPNPEPIPEEPLVTTTASTDTSPATTPPAGQDAGGSDKAAAKPSPKPAPQPSAPAAARPPLTAPETGDPLEQALGAERSSLEAMRVKLVEELQRVERDIEAVDARASHVDALLEPDAFAAAS